MSILSLIIFLPALGSLIVLSLPREKEKNIQWVGLSATFVTFIVTVGFTLSSNILNLNTHQFQWQENIPWIKNLGIHYHIGVDGISIWLLNLTALISFLAVGISFYIQEKIKALIICLLILETSLLGVFSSLDLILFYSFFEISLLPMFLLINIWGGINRAKAAMKFLIFTFIGSIFMLIGMITLALLHKQATGQMSFGLIEIQNLVANGQLWINSTQFQPLIFWSFAIAFMVKSPIFPLHTWLPSAYKESPIPLLVLSAVVLKMGSYGFLRFCFPLFPEATAMYIPVLMVLAVIGIIYGAILACVQKDIISIIAYSSISHMGFVFVGILSMVHIGLVGGALQQINHGITTGLIFLLIGFLYVRRNTFEINQFGGLKANMPILATLFMIAVLSSAGLPATNGFVSEFLSLLGAFQAGFKKLFGLNYWLIVFATCGVVLSAIYLLRLYQAIFHGEIKHPLNLRLKDIKISETAMACVLVIAVVWIGLYPSSLTKSMESSLHHIRAIVMNPVGEKPTWQLDSNQKSYSAALKVNLPKLYICPDSYIISFDNINDKTQFLTSKLSEIIIE